MILNNDARHLNLELVDEATVNNNIMINNIDGEENDDTKEANIENKDNSERYVEIFESEKRIMTGRLCQERLYSQKTAKKQE